MDRNVVLYRYTKIIDNKYINLHFYNSLQGWLKSSYNGYVEKEYDKPATRLDVFKFIIGLK